MLQVLIADDDKELSRQLGYAVGIETRSQCKISVADSGRRAIELIRQRSFDIVVTDVMMESTLAGREVLQASRRKSQDTPVIIVTTYPDRFTQADALQLGAFAYLDRIRTDKPLLDAFQIELRRAVELLASRHRIRATAWFEDAPDRGPSLDVGVPRTLSVALVPEGAVPRPVAFRGVVPDSLEVVVFARNAAVEPCSRRLPVSAEHDAHVTFHVTPDAAGTVEVECVFLVKGEPMHRLVIVAPVQPNPKRTP